MASVPKDRLPLHTIILPVLGTATWLAIGKVSLEPLALVLAAVLLGNVIAAVHHAEVVAISVGEPFGTLILALAVTVIEVGLIISMMLGGKPNPALVRDSVHAVVMLVLTDLPVCASSSAPSASARPNSAWKAQTPFSLCCCRWRCLCWYCPTT